MASARARRSRCACRSIARLLGSWRHGPASAATPHRAACSSSRTTSTPLTACARSLELDGHVVEVAYTGREGIEKARAFQPDVVLCDIGLPGMDGYEVARAMRADPELGTVGLVALTGYAQPEDVERASEAGFDAHLAKPPSIDTLERALAEVGNARHYQRALN